MTHLTYTIDSYQSDLINKFNTNNGIEFYFYWIARKKHSPCLEPVEHPASSYEFGCDDVPATAK